MRHCHFSILFNELPYLKQKLPFLYQFFDQIIFYDLNIVTKKFSDDGSHEFIKNYPDPENKITLIEDITITPPDNKWFGAGSSEKQKMFRIGSSYVKDNIDVFWCFDMDEFFDSTLIPKVEEKMLNAPEDLLYGIQVPHLIFFKDQRYRIVQGDLTPKPLPWPRIYKHSPGRIYPHCLADGNFPHCSIPDELIYHLSFCGIQRNLLKAKHRQSVSKSMMSLISTKDIPISTGEIKYLGQVHERKDWALTLNTYPIPEYMHIEQIFREIKEIDDKAPPPPPPPPKSQHKLPPQRKPRPPSPKPVPPPKPVPITPPKLDPAKQPGPQLKQPPRPQPQPRLPSPVRTELDKQPKLRLPSPMRLEPATIQHQPPPAQPPPKPPVPPPAPAIPIFEAAQTPAIYRPRLAEIIRQQRMPKHLDTKK
jgi:hypothetical protein